MLTNHTAKEPISLLKETLVGKLSHLVNMPEKDFLKKHALFNEF